jgi:glycosyltransferase involved in cell wall biosynthesis
MKIAVVSTYPPRPCGIGTFTADLRDAVQRADPAAEVNIVSIVTEETLMAPISGSGRLRGAAAGDLVREHPPEVTASLRQHDRDDYAAVAQQLADDGTDVVLIEHEYGIFGGEAGEYVLSLMAELTQPAVVTFHTVLSSPSPAQATTFRALCRLATLVTVFTDTARRMVVEGGFAEAERVRVVPHGAPPQLVARALARSAEGPTSGPSIADAVKTGGIDVAMQARLHGRTVLSTFGLISSGKGIELAIDALAKVVPAHPEVLYLIAGQTHPEVAKHEGESYRERLAAQVHALGLTNHVRFLDRFLGIDELALLLASTDLYVTPYRSKEQIVSGALTFAVAAGCPVVSTPYFYAEDLLGSGAGMLVPFDDSQAMATAISELLEAPDELAAMRAESARIGSSLSWHSVGEVTLDTLAEAIAAGKPRPAERAPGSLVLRPDHLLAMTDDVGIIQHANGVTPRWDSGYCVDDVARLVLVAIQLGDRLPGHRHQRMIRSGLAFLNHAWDPSVPGLHNFLGYDRRWVDQAGGGDHVGRAMWTLGEVIAAQLPSGESRPSLRQLEAMGHYLLTLSSPRAVAFALLGLVRPDPKLLPETLLQLRDHLARRLAEIYDAHATPDWPWFEPYLTYDNARLPQAMIAAGARLEDAGLLARGLRSLDWYVSQCSLESGQLGLVGNSWRRQRERGTVGGEGDEQPLDAAALVEANVEAFMATGDKSYGDLALASFEWFLGRNRLGVALYDAETGGCHDGLSTAGPNDNQGAESTLAFWQALLALERAGLQTFTLLSEPPPPTP